ncbi:hypothetical protein LguiA_023426 [Lonicera macranthoides]
MVAKGHRPVSPKVEVGEIDTRSPFQSVKDAVSLFGEVAFSSGEKPAIRKAKPRSAESVYAKETRLHLAQKELNKLKEQLKNAETTKAQAHQELEVAKSTLEDLTEKLKALSEAKESAIKATEAARDQAKQLEEATSGSPTGTDGAAWQQDLETSRKQYMAAVSELDAAKQGLRKIRQDCDSTMEEKDSTFKQAAEAEDAAKANMGRAGELSKEITAIKESIEQVKLATLQAQQEQTTIYAEKDIQKQSYKAKLEESAEKFIALKREIDPELTENLESQLAETEFEIGAVQKQMDNAKASDLGTVRSVTLELDEAKDSLHKVADDESSLRSLVESLKLELENVKKEHSELKEKEAETESVAGNLNIKLRKSKSELEAVIAEESKVVGASEEMILTLHQLSSESENAKREAEEMRKQAEDMKKEAEATRIALEETEKRLRAAMQEAEEAKAAEARALDEIKIMSEKANAARSLSSEPGVHITISREEFESLSRKVEESDKLAEMKVAAAMAQVEAVKASENESVKKLEATQKEIDEMKAATQEVVKKAEMAEAAKKAVEGELRRWREREQKKAAEAASRILAETEMASGSSPSNLRTEMALQSSPRGYQVQKQKQKTPEKVVGKLEKARTSVSKRVLLPSLSLFYKKRNQVEGGSPSYLPGEKPM